MTKNTYTRAMLLNDLKAMELNLNPEQMEVLDKWIVALGKKSVRVPDPRKVEERNRVKAAIMEAITANSGADINASWLANHVNGVMTPQKATSLVSDLIKEGKIKKREDSKRVFYELA